MEEVIFEFCCKGQAAGGNGLHRCGSAAWTAQQLSSCGELWEDGAQGLCQGECWRVRLKPGPLKTLRSILDSVPELENSHSTEHIMKLSHYLHAHSLPPPLRWTLCEARHVTVSFISRSPRAGRQWALNACLGERMHEVLLTGRCGPCS